MVYSKVSILVFVALFSAVGLAHGKIAMVECYSSKTDIRVRVQESVKDKSLEMVTFKPGNKQDAVATCQSPKIEDLVEGKKIVEKIELASGSNILSLQIPEIYAHKIRRGEGTLKVGSAKPEILKDCMLVYKQ